MIFLKFKNSFIPGLPKMYGNSSFKFLAIVSLPLEPTRKVLFSLLIFARNFVSSILISKEDGYFLNISKFCINVFLSKIVFISFF